MAGQINEGDEKLPWRHEVARACGSFTRPDLAIPCRVASPQSPTPLHQARRIIAGREQEKKLHPARFSRYTMDLTEPSFPGGASTGCNLKVFSIASNDTSLLFTESPDGRKRRPD